MIVFAFQLHSTMSQETGDVQEYGKDTVDEAKESPASAAPMEPELEPKVRYKYCVVPGCRSTTNKTPHKLFFSMPTGEQRRAWCDAMGRSAPPHKPLSAKCNRFCCEDHFDLEKDMENYMQWKIMGSKKTKKLIIKKGVVPHKFDFQGGDKDTSLKKLDEKTHNQIIEEILNERKAQEKEMESKLMQRVDSKMIKLNLKRKLIGDVKQQSIKERMKALVDTSEEKKIMEQLKKIKKIPHPVQETEIEQEKKIEIKKYTFHIKVEVDEDDHSNDGEIKEFMFHKFTASNSCNFFNVNVKIEELNDGLKPDVLELEDTIKVRENCII